MCVHKNEMQLLFSTFINVIVYGCKKRLLIMICGTIIDENRSCGRNGRLNVQYP